MENTYPEDCQCAPDGDFTPGPEPEMPYFVGVKVIQARPMTRHMYVQHKDLPAYHYNCEDEPGYLVRYADGYESWSPRRAFEDAYFVMPSKKDAEDMEEEAKKELQYAVGA